MSNDAVFGIFSSSQFWLATPVLAALIKFAWEGASFLIALARRGLMARTGIYQIDLGSCLKDFPVPCTFGCLITRYGTDPYIRYMASERERDDGRLQNRVIVPLAVTLGQGTIELRLPVHRRIGTQFKCFAEIRSRDKLAKLTEALSRCDNIHDITKSSLQGKGRAYFLLSDFGVVETVEGFKNNIWLPV